MDHLAFEVLDPRARNDPLTKGAISMPRGPVRIIPHLRTEPDHHALAVAALMLLDELEGSVGRRKASRPDADKPKNGDSC